MLGGDVLRPKWHPRRLSHIQIEFKEEFCWGAPNRSAVKDLRWHGSEMTCEVGAGYAQCSWVVRRYRTRFYFHLFRRKFQTARLWLLLELSLRLGVSRDSVHTPALLRKQPLNNFQEAVKSRDLQWLRISQLSTGILFRAYIQSKVAPCFCG